MQSSKNGKNNNEESLIFYNEEDTKLFAQNFAQNLHQGNIITFSGSLGTGKTFICREIIKYLSGMNTNVISPSFNLLQIYTSPKFMIYHFDLYRLKYLEEIDELGIEDAMENHLCLIEWPEIISPIVKSPYIRINLEIMEHNQRLCTINYI